MDKNRKKIIQKDPFGANRQAKRLFLFIIIIFLSIDILSQFPRNNKPTKQHRTILSIDVVSQSPPNNQTTKQHRTILSIDVVSQSPQNNKTTCQQA